MNTANYETENNIKTAKNYYNFMLVKDYEKMASCLHNNVHFLGPITEIRGKEEVVAAAKNFGEVLDIQIKSPFAAANQVMFAYDVTVPQPIGKFKAAVLMEFMDGLISKIELFFDTRPFPIK